MDPLHPIDRIRARAAGELSPEELLELESRIAADPELAQLAEAYDDVHRVTEAALSAEGAPAASRAELADLDRWLDGAHGGAAMPALSRIRMRRVAAAAVLLVAAAGATFLGWRAWGGTSEVVLHAIPAELPALDEDPAFAATVERLASYAPVRDGGIAWIDDIDEGRAMAFATGRPLLLWGVHPTCPFCKKMRETTMLDNEVLEAVEEFVPLQLDVMVTERYADLDPFDKGFPIFELLAPDFEELDTFFNYHEPVAFTERLAAGLERHAGPPTLSWERAAELARAWREARAAESERRFGDALDTYEALLDHGQGFSISDAAARGITRIARAARLALEQAEARDEPGEILAVAARDFAGTRYGSDFESLGKAVRSSGKLPQLVWER